MLPYRQRFLRLALDAGVIRFGEFTLKSGRQSPYFFDLGRLSTGQALAELASCYADALVDWGLAVDQLFGPAYKGIVLASATAHALALRHGRNLPYIYDRKEAKDHGEGGLLVGSALAGRVLVIDDVLTAGTAVRHAMSLIRAHGAQAVGLLLALDRQERGPSGQSAVQELENAGVQVRALARFEDLLRHLEESGTQDREARALRRYGEQWGLAPV